MNTKIILVIALCISVQTNAQITFQKIIGGTGILDYDYANSIQQTMDGGYIIAGNTRSFGAVNDNVYLIKTDGSGNVLWTKTFGGTEYDYGYSVQQTTDGGYIIAGTTNSFGAGQEDVYLIKTNDSGDTLWTKTFGGTGQDEGRSVQQITGGGYIIAGYTVSFGAGYYDVYLIKTDDSGNTIWTKTFGGAGSGTIGYDYGYSVQETTDGGYIIAGATNSFGPDDYDVYLIKTNDSGDTLWTKTFGGTLGDYGYSVKQTTDGGYIITGVTFSFGAGGGDAYLLKTDNNGNALWSKTFSVTGGAANEYGYSVHQTTDGGYIIAGSTFSGAGSADVYLVKTDQDGNALWSKYFGETIYDESYSVQQTTDGGYIIAGMTSSFGAGPDVYLIKTDANGNSGCNEGNPAIITNAAATVVLIPATLVSIVSSTETIPATITGSGGTDSTLCTSVGIEEIAIGNSALIYPNPVDEFLVIKNSFPGDESVTVKFFDVAGREIFSSQLKTSNQKLKTQNLKNGIYFCQLKSNDKIFNQKFVVQH